MKSIRYAIVRLVFNHPDDMDVDKTVEKYHFYFAPDIDAQWKGCNLSDMELVEVVKECPPLFTD